MAITAEPPDTDTLVARCAAMGETELMGAVLDTGAQIQRLQVRRIIEILELDDRGVCVDRGHRSVAHWLHTATNLEIGECTRLLAFARLMRTDPQVWAAYARGDLDADKARQIARFCADCPATMTSADVDAARTILIDHASRTVATTGTVRALIRRLEHRFGRDPDGPPPGEDSTRNELYASRTLHGRVVVKADLDALTGARLLHLLSGLSAPHPRAGGIADTRSPALRRADGFAELLRRCEAAGIGPVDGGTRPRLSVTASLRDLTTLAGAAELLATTPTDGYATEQWAGPISLETARMLACDSLVARIVIDEHGIPLAHGRTHRTATAAQRRALALRDGGCSFPGCTAPAPWCEAHHLIHWADGGGTDLDNLVLVCGHHHRFVHHTGWRVRMDPHGRPVYTPPESVDPLQIPIPGNMSGVPVGT